jgi:hypothetical protein
MNFQEIILKLLYPDIKPISIKPNQIDYLIKILLFMQNHLKSRKIKKIFH